MQKTPEESTFHLFPNLPPELRDKIWLHALPSAPRLISYAATTTPSIATVNSESRAIFLSIYRKCFVPDWRPLPYPISPYANLSLDILLINRDIQPNPFPLSAWITAEGIQGLKHLAFPIVESFFFHNYITEFEKVESLTMAIVKAGKLQEPRHQHFCMMDEQHALWETNYKWLWLLQKSTKAFPSLRVGMAEVGA
jgi:hypothetical protein